MSTALPGMLTPRLAAPRLALACATSPMPLASTAFSSRCVSVANECGVLITCVPGYGVGLSDRAGHEISSNANARTSDEAPLPLVASCNMAYLPSNLLVECPADRVEVAQPVQREARRKHGPGREEEQIVAIKRMQVLAVARERRYRMQKQHQCVRYAGSEANQEREEEQHLGTGDKAHG